MQPTLLERATYWLIDHTIGAIFDHINKILDQNDTHHGIHPSWTNHPTTRYYLINDPTTQAIKQHLQEQGYHIQTHQPDLHLPAALQITHPTTHPEIQTHIHHHDTTLYATHHTATGPWETTYDLNHPKSLHHLEQDLQHQFGLKPTEQPCTS